MPFDIIGLGVSTLDVLMQVEGFPAGETVQPAAAATIQGGGPVATAIATAARLGAHTAMIDTLGDDRSGHFILDDFRGCGVDISLLTSMADRTSSLATILVRQSDGARAITFKPGTVDELDAGLLPDHALARAGILHINGRHWQACLAAASAARNHGVRISFDGGAQRYRDELLQLLPMVDICIVARQFASACTGGERIDEMLQALQQLGPALVVITDGLAGSWIKDGTRDVFHQAAFVVDDIIDTTGCGDAYHGGFLYALSQGMTVDAAATLASAVAAINAQGLGGRGNLPDRVTLDRFIRKYDGS